MNHEPLVFTASDLFLQSLATVVPLDEIAAACFTQIKTIPVVSTEDGWKQQAKYILKTKKTAIEKKITPKFKIKLISHHNIYNIIYILLLKIVYLNDYDQYKKINRTYHRQR